MSIPYPRNFDQNLDEEVWAARYEAVVKQLDPGDVIAEVEDQVAQIVAPKAHPLYAVVSKILGGHDTPHGILFGKARPNMDAAEEGASWTRRYNCGRGGCRC
jgi:hypothetical protein